MAEKTGGCISNCRSLSPLHFEEGNLKTRPNEFCWARVREKRSNNLECTRTGAGAVDFFILLLSRISY